MDLAHVGALRSSFVDNFYVELDRFWTQHDSTSQPIFQHPCNFVAFDTKSKVCFRPGSPLVTVTKKNHHIVQFLVVLCMSLLVTVVGRWQRYAFT